MYQHSKNIVFNITGDYNMTNINLPDRSKREFIKHALAGTAAFTMLSNVTIPSFVNAEETTTPKSKIQMPPLPYAENALEPYISQRTLHIHYNEHHRFFTEQVTSRIKGTELENSTLEQIISATKDSINLTKTLNLMAILSWNHSFYWKSMKPSGSPVSPLLSSLINSSFGNSTNFKNQFIELAMQPGSGWVWLVQDGTQLKIVYTEYHDTPLLNNQTPLLALDCWEHAYYLDYQNRKIEYVQNFLDKIADWSFAEQNLKSIEKTDKVKK
jgi:Fe-Mn family superoxide dismutase